MGESNGDATESAEGAEAQETSPEKGLSNLSKRLIAAAILIPPTIYLVWIGGLPFMLAIMVIVVLGLQEFYNLPKSKGANPLATAGMVAAVALPVVAYLGNEYHVTLLLTFVLLGVMVAQLRKREISSSLESISGTFFGVFYVAWLLSHAIVLRNFSEVVAGKWGTDVSSALPLEVGRFYVLLAIAVVAACDAGAYFAGRAYGKHKLAPVISPGKTVEGAIGGVLAALLMAFLVRGIFTLGWPEIVPAGDGIAWLMTGAVGIILGLAGIVGDLIESLLKRDAAVKDTGTLIPGSGGVLDRIDSHLLAIPTLYYMLLAYTYLRLEL
jgi:phosphatidate cytidylyltransferase